MTDGMTFECIKAYDVRGVVPDQLNPAIAERIVWALVKLLEPKSCVIGWDVRSHGPMLVDALTQALIQNGVDVMHLGLAGTEEVYYWAGEHNLDLGLMVTASHNPAEYNGIKIVRHGAAPMVGETSMQVVKDLATSLASAPRPASQPGRITVNDDKSAYIEKLLTFVDQDKLRPLKLVINSGNGVAGPVVDRLVEHLPFDIVQVHNQPDSQFPNGIPNPLLPEKRADTIRAVKEHQADLGIAFDGDFDRCFFFDADGCFIEGYYIVGLLTQALLPQHPGGTICYDPRLIWNTEAIVKDLGGEPNMTPSGHTFLKAGMRDTNAVYGGEMSAHHYFRDFYFCDSGMVPWLLVAQLVSTSGKSLKQLVDEMIANFPCTGEVNFALSNRAVQQAKIEQIHAAFMGRASQVETLDGLSMAFEEEGWRFNVRSSNTEPLLRLNIETKRDVELAAAKLNELSRMISS